MSLILDQADTLDEAIRMAAEYIEGERLNAPIENDFLTELIKQWEEVYGATR